MSLDKPHDALFRFAWSDLPTARAHFQSVLPPELVARVDWATLNLRPGSFVDETFRDLHSDLLFGARTRSGAPLRIYLLFEHQSTADPLMPFRLLRYMVRIWDTQLRADPPERLAPIIPLVLYHGRERWTVPADMVGVLSLQGDDDAVFEPYAPRFRYVLQDLSATSDHALRGTALGRMVLLLFKHALEGDFWAHVLSWKAAFGQVRRSANGLDAINALLRYMILVAPLPPAPQVVKALEQALGPIATEHLMTWAEQLLETGRKEGLEKGMEKGMQKGMEKGRERGWEEHARRSVERVLAVRFPAEDLTWLSDALSPLDAAALDAALDAALRTPSIAPLRVALVQRRPLEG